MPLCGATLRESQRPWFCCFRTFLIRPPIFKGLNESTAKVE